MRDVSIAFIGRSSGACVLFVCFWTRLGFKNMFWDSTPPGKWTYVVAVFGLVPPTFLGREVVIGADRWVGWPHVLLKVWTNPRACTSMLTKFCRAVLQFANVCDEQPCTFDQYLEFARSVAHRSTSWLRTDGGLTIHPDTPSKVPSSSPDIKSIVKPPPEVPVMWS